MKKIITLFAVFACVLFTGCGREIDDMAYVIAIGVDGAENGLYEFTFAIGNPGSINGGGGEDAGGGGDDALITESSISDNIFTAGDEVSARIGQEINFSHSELLVFSRSVAKEGVGGFLDSLTRNLSQRPKLVPAVAEGAAAEVLKGINSKFEGNPEKYLKKIFESRESIASADIDIRSFLCRTKNESIAAAVPCIRGGDTVSAASMSVFYGDRLAGELDDAVAYKLVSGRLKDISYSVGGMGAINLTQRIKPYITVSCRAEPVINITVFLDGTVASIGKGVKREGLYAEAEKSLKASFEKLLEQSKSMGADIFGFERYARGDFLIWEAWKSYNWKEKYKSSRFNVSVKISPEKTGLIRGD